MTRIALIIVIILSIGSLVVGKIHWNHKISAFSGMASTVKVEEEKTEPAKETSTLSSKTVDLAQITINLPDNLKAKIETAQSEKKPVKLSILGSKSTSSEPNAWPTILSQKLTEAYGEGLFEVAINEIKDKNSLEVVDEKLYSESLDFNPDILLLEPFILKDNGEVRMEDRIENLQTIMDAFEERNPGVIILIQPANPLYNATYYPKEVEELKRFATDNGISYLDHWQAWPELESSEIEKYLMTDPDSPGKSIPNEEGHKIWADFLVNYFVGK
jgi:vacuolar-type H+-ATPase subunit F/Vma7